MRTTKPHPAANGSKWIRPNKRLAIYLRDGLSCCWCGYSIEDGERFTLDHLTPHCKGGSNDERNLITACGRCNFSRQDRSKKAFAEVVAQYHGHGLTAEEILRHIDRTRRRSLKQLKKEAAAILTRRQRAEGETTC